MNTIVIRHDRQMGTLVYGVTRKDRDVHAVLDDANFSFDRYDSLPIDDELGWPSWYLTHSRRGRADRWKIDAVAAQLRELGREVRVEIDDTTPAVGFAAFRQEKYDRAELRAECHAYRARRMAWESDAIHASNRAAFQRLNGQPILVGHYSEKPHRNYLAKLGNRDSKAARLYEESQELFASAYAAERMQARAENPGTTQRRIKDLEATLRRIGRGIEATSGKHALKVLRADLFETIEELDYWHQVLDDSGAKVWGPTDFAKGDFVLSEFRRWHEIGRVNKATVSVANRFGSVGQQVWRVTDLVNGRPARCETMRYDEVRGKLTAAEAREQWPDLFKVDADAVQAPAKPRRKSGKIKLDHSTGAYSERWWWTVDGCDYQAFWKHPEGWYSQPRGELTDISAVKVTSRPTPAYFKIGGYTTEVGEIPMAGPVWWAEQVHNQVRAYVEAQSYVPVSPEPESAASASPEGEHGESTPA